MSWKRIVDKHTGEVWWECPVCGAHWSRQFCRNCDLPQAQSPPQFGRPDDPRSLQQAIDEEAPHVWLHVGCGSVVLHGFLNADIGARAPFQFNAADRWPCRDACVGYVFSEDFLEHLNQHQQMCFFAEAYRALMSGGKMHVSTPDLDWIMTTRSQFNEGRAGVYDEWARWGHLLVHTEESLVSMAALVGFVPEISCRMPWATRPGADRDSALGNLYVDLIKPSDGSSPPSCPC